jgi:hypothetical protein
MSSWGFLLLSGRPLFSHFAAGRGIVTFLTIAAKIKIFERGYTWIVDDISPFVIHAVAMETRINVVFANGWYRLAARTRRPHQVVIPPDEKNNDNKGHSQSWQRKHEAYLAQVVVKVDAGLDCPGSNAFVSKCHETTSKRERH